MVTLISTSIQPALIAENHLSEKKFFILALPSISIDELIFPRDSPDLSPTVISPNVPFSQQFHLRIRVWDSPSHTATVTPPNDRILQLYHNISQVKDNPDSLPTSTHLNDHLRWPPNILRVVQGTALVSQPLQHHQISFSGCCGIAILLVKVIALAS